MSPLAGVTVVVTRPESRAREWVEALQAAGATVVSFPVFELVGVSGEAENDALQAFERSAQRSGAWLAFTSEPGVTHLATMVGVEPGDGRLHGFRIASVGPATTRALESRGFDVELEASGASASSLAREILAIDPGPVVVHVTSDVGLPTLVSEVERAGGEGVRLVAYGQRRVPDLDPSRLPLAQPGEPLLTFASPSAARGLLESATADVATTLQDLSVVAVGDTTAAELRALGFGRITVASSPGVEGLVAAVVRAASPR